MRSRSPNAKVVMTSNGGAGALFCDVMLLGRERAVSAKRSIPLPRPTPLSRAPLGRLPRGRACACQRCTGVPRSYVFIPTADLHALHRRTTLELGRPAPAAARSTASRSVHRPPRPVVRGSLHRGDRRARRRILDAHQPRRLFDGHHRDRHAGRGALPEDVGRDHPALLSSPRPQPEGVGDRTLVIHFLEEEPTACWPECFAPLESALEGSACGRLLLAAPFLPTVPGTDQYLDEI